MIEIVKPVINEEKHEIVCNNCSCLLKYEDDDLEMCGNEQGFFCPNCNEFIVAKKYPPFQFPISFYHFGENALKLSDEEIQKYINMCVKNVKETIGTEDWDYACSGTGNTFVEAIRDEEENITVRVAKNYYEAVEFK